MVEGEGAWAHVMVVGALQRHDLGLVEHSCDHLAPLRTKHVAREVEAGDPRPTEPWHQRLETLGLNDALRQVKARRCSAGVALQEIAQQRHVLLRQADLLAQIERRGAALLLEDGLRRLLDDSRDRRVEPLEEAR